VRAPRAVRWRVNHYRARWLHFKAVRLFPSELQREFNRGDPDGRVRAVADAIIAEMQEEGGRP
jgi:hypothetical protein